MENTAKKKSSDKKEKKKKNDIKEKILSGKAVLSFDEEIEFNKCCSIGANLVEDTNEVKKKNISDANNNPSKGTVLNKKKGQKKNEKEQIDNINKNYKDKSKKNCTLENKTSNNKSNNIEEANIYNINNNYSSNQHIYKINEFESNLSKNDTYNLLDSSTNSSASPRICRNNNDLKKKNSTKIAKLESSNNIINIEEDNGEFNKWIELMPNINSQIETILKNQLPCYNILNNIKRINKIRNISFNENNEMLNSIEKSNIMFNSVNISSKEKYIIRFLCEGSICNLTELVDLLYYVLNNNELTYDMLPVKFALDNNTKMEKSDFLITNDIEKKNIKSNDCSPIVEIDKENKITDNNNSPIENRNINMNNENDISIDNLSDDEYLFDDAENEKLSFNSISISKENLYSCIPILLSRKNLGNNMKIMNVSKNDNNEKECLWVWENDNYDSFPSYYKEIFKYYKELRSNISKIYKTLIKLKSSIMSKDLQNTIKMYDYLNELKKRQYMESEKRCKRILIEKKKISKKKMEIKKQEEKKTSTIVKLDTAVQNKVEEKKSKQQNLILSWLTLKKSQGGNALNSNDNTEHIAKHSIANFTNLNNELSENLQKAQSQLPIFSCNKKATTESFITFTENANYDKEKLFNDYVDVCTNHKKLVTDYFKLYVDNKEFIEEIPSVDSIDGSKIVMQNEKDVRSKIWEDNEFYLKLKNSDYVRSFFFYDNSWTRPYMALLVNKVLDDNINLYPFYYHDDMEYENDTNEDYYEKFEAIDLTTENEENETESDGSSQDMFIVPDNEINKDIEITPLVVPTSQDIYFFSLFNWEWKFEGNERRNYNILDKNTWKEFNLIYKDNNYGCQYMTWGKDNNPFRYLADTKNMKNTLDDYDIKRLIKHSHGKVTKKDILVDQFKLKYDHLTKADTERKFKIYLTYVKCEDNRKKWMASEEGIKLFNNEELLKKIYQIRKRKLNVMSQKMEAVKRQKKMDKENLKKEEKIKKKEKTTYEKLATKESLKKDETMKDIKKTEEESITKSETSNSIQKLLSNGLISNDNKTDKKL
ncbi:conserved Plasmodium protein, unknown function [Plasmodium yoelii]|uniref:Uncharacterized protein n=2 Tax=Plasmodium yoelii TaxID=5861 RepID=A0AAE9X2Q4_PLAYO|nr:conserved Plasmodium protein, unknown function [Plasmodium yoelii]WBY60773.1 hypothetical protein Py17XNL_001401045 [Plasmodium yoelii yoelii]CDU20549.1 conserved Plasmodium protein, unknown function [Plasmodium yoelii]VTZ81510.1 conserved Plasmodium protein, unknown function [Plasmodium yoelii]|eukprot:XP_022812873.1 conserved Plasmodium protein, unknown function [Plasmodium yoelii]